MSRGLITEFFLENYLENTDIHLNIYKRHKRKTIDFQLNNLKKFKYTLIKIDKNLFYSIPKSAYIYIDSKNFIPNLGFPFFFDGVSKFKFSDKIILTDKYFNITKSLKCKIGEDGMKKLIDFNKKVSKYNRDNKNKLLFCGFVYHYTINYVIQDFNLAIKIFDNDGDEIIEIPKEIFEKIYSCVCENLEKTNKDFLINKLYHTLEVKNKHINDLEFENIRLKKELSQYKLMLLEKNNCF